MLFRITVCTRVFFMATFIISCGAFIARFQDKFASSSSQLILNAWGVKKVDIIGITVTDSQPEIGSPLNVPQRPSTGTGYDSRFPGQGDQDDEIEQLVCIDKNIRQLSLMKELSGSAWSQAEKLKRVQVSAQVECLLPAPSISSMNLASGGLMNDWNFN